MPTSPEAPSLGPTVPELEINDGFSLNDSSEERPVATTPGTTGQRHRYSRAQLINMSGNTLLSPVLAAARYHEAIEHNQQNNRQPRDHQIKINLCPRPGRRG